MGLMVFLWAPWVFSEPIAELPTTETPPPPEARSFAWNRGEPVYFVHGPALEHPWKLAAIAGAFLVLWATFIWLALCLWSLSRSSPSDKG